MSRHAIDASNYLVVRLFVDLAYVLLSPVFFVVLLVLSRGFTNPKFARGWAQKFGSVPKREGDKPSFWVHAVSVGEVIVAQPLIEDLRREFPEWDVSLSVSTVTGFDLAQKRFTGIDVFFAPVDFGPVVSRVFRRRRPTVVVLIELEMWPGFLLTSRAHGVPVYVVNGRITEKSAGKYVWAGPLSRGLFGLVHACGVQTEEYARRFAEVGVPESRLAVLGNLKHDRKPSPDAADGEVIRQQVGWHRGDEVVLVGGSTHPGEESILCELYEALGDDCPKLRLVIAPRHVERLTSSELPRWSAKSDLIRWSEVRSAASTRLGSRVLVVDSFGELEKFYHLADVVFVGGTLVPHGGHNLFEAAQLKRAILCGPHVQNFREEADLLFKSESAIQVADAAELRDRARELTFDASRREKLAENAYAVTNSLRGARRRHLDWLSDQMRLFISTGD